jgi:hypothetical protein
MGKSAYREKWDGPCTGDEDGGQKAEQQEREETGEIKGLMKPRDQVTRNKSPGSRTGEEEEKRGACQSNGKTSRLLQEAHHPEADRILDARIEEDDEEEG